MGIFTVIFLSFTALLFIYLLFYIFAKREIDRSDEVRKKGNEVYISARAQSLEYLLRMAVASQADRIIVYININAADAKESESIALDFSHNEKYVEIRYTDF